MKSLFSQLFHIDQIETCDYASCLSDILKIFQQNLKLFSNRSKSAIKYNKTLNSNIFQQIQDQVI